MKNLGGKLRVTLVQAVLEWESPGQNMNHLRKLLQNIRKNATDIIILPEMFTTGFTMNAAGVAHTMQGDAIDWMMKLASEKNAAICGSLVITERKKFYNRLIWMNPDGTFVTYDKRHLFRMARENKVYTGGNKRVVVEWRGFRICPLVCYDLRFPVWSRNRNDYDLLVYVANWPAARKYAWEHLLIARAIENQAFVIGVNRTGKDGNGIAYPGASMLLDPLGGIITHLKQKETVSTNIINISDLNKLRKVFPVSHDADKFSIKI